MKDLYIDPSVSALGWATFEHSKLSGCGVLRAAGLEEMLVAVKYALWFEVDELGVERPRIYSGLQMKGDPNDLMQTMCVVGAVVGAVRWATLKMPFPHEWKGNVPKEIHHQRCEAALEGHELSQWLLLKGHLAHNARDAVGLGLKLKGRIR